MDIRLGGESFESSAIPALMLGDNGVPVRVDVAVIPITFVDAKQEGIGLVFANEPGKPFLMFDATGSRTVLAEVLRHVRPTEKES